MITFQAKGINECIADFRELTESEQDELLKWCKSLNKTKVFNAYLTSYGLKHVFERSRGGFYVTNDQFKGAMMLAGFRACDYQAMYWDFNVSALSVKDEEIKPKLMHKYDSIGQYGSKSELERKQKLWDFVMQDSPYIMTNIQKLTSKKIIGNVAGEQATRDEFKGALLSAGYEPLHASSVVWNNKK